MSRVAGTTESDGGVRRNHTEGSEGGVRRSPTESDGVRRSPTEESDGGVRRRGPTESNGGVRQSSTEESDEGVRQRSPTEESDEEFNEQSNEGVQRAVQWGVQRAVQRGVQGKRPEDYKPISGCCFSNLVQGELSVCRSFLGTHNNNMWIHNSCMYKNKATSKQENTTFE